MFSKQASRQQPPAPPGFVTHRTTQGYPVTVAAWQPVATATPQPTYPTGGPAGLGAPPDRVWNQTAGGRDGVQEGSFKANFYFGEVPFNSADPNINVQPITEAGLAAVAGLAVDGVYSIVVPRRAVHSNSEFPISEDADMIRFTILSFREPVTWADACKFHQFDMKQTGCWVKTISKNLRGLSGSHQCTSRLAVRFNGGIANDENRMEWNPQALLALKVRSTLQKIEEDMNTTPQAAQRY